MIENAPKHQRQPGPSRKAVEIGPPSQMVMILGDEVKAVMRPRLCNLVVSATKMFIV